MHLNSINYFRGIAILFIVFGHCLGVADFKYISIPGKAIFNLTTGGTTFFVFISGFLFHHVFYKKFKFQRFLIKKSKYVLFPYLILSTIPIVCLLLSIAISGILSLTSFPLYYEALSSFPIAKHYLTGVGKSFFGYWYIPFIMIIFTMSPIFIQFIKLKLKTQILIASFLFIGSIFMHRGTYQSMFSIFQEVVFYIPIYLFGILCSEKKEYLYSKLTGKEFYLFTLIISLAVLQTYTGKFGNYIKNPFTFAGIDIMSIQKIIFCLFFMILLHRFEHYKLSVLDTIAKNSFGIFFIHGIVIMGIKIIKEEFDFSFTSNSVITYGLIATLVFSLSLITTLLVKKVFPKYSKYLIGS